MHTPQHLPHIHNGHEELVREGLLLTKAAYDNGAGMSLEVTQTRQAHTTAGLNLATQKFNAQLALLKILDAIGENISEQIR